MLGFNTFLIFLRRFKLILFLEWYSRHSLTLGLCTDASVFALCISVCWPLRQFLNDNWLANLGSSHELFFHVQGVFELRTFYQNPFAIRSGTVESGTVEDA
jgi:hypothetical protein